MASSTPQRIILTANTDWYLFNFRKSLIKALVRDGWDVYIVTNPGIYANELSKLGCRFIPWKISRQSINPITEKGSITQLRNIYNKLAPDLIHQHTLKSVIYGNIAAEKTNIPIINSIAGRGYVYSSKHWKAKLLKPILDYLLRKSMKYPKQQVVFENNIDQQYFIEKGILSPDQCHLIKGVGVDLELFDSTPLPPTDIFTVGYAGRMLWSKGVGVFVEAARIIKSETDGVKMVLIGSTDPDNPESVSEEKLREWEEEKIIELWGWHDSMSGVYRNIHALALPTNYGEGVPTVLLEAGASQRALIATETPGCMEVITHKHNGLLVPVDNPDALSKAVLYLSKNKEEYNRLRKSAKETIQINFSAEGVIKQTYEVYNLALKS